MKKETVEPMELIIAVGEIAIKSNLEEFKAKALKTIEGSDKKLVTVEEFSQAELTIKHCVKFESALVIAKEKALGQTGDLNALFATIDALEEEFKRTRLALDRQVKQEKARKKEEVVTSGKEKVARYIKVSALPDSYTVSTTTVDTAIKGKRTVESMEKAVKKAVDILIAEIDEVEKNYLLACKSIGEAEAETPGLFPDKEALAFKPIETVNAVVESRVAKYLLAKKEQEEKEALKAKEVLKAKEALKAREALEVKDEPATEPENELVKTTVQPLSGQRPAARPPEQQKEVSVSAAPSTDQLKTYVFSMTFVSGRERAIEIAKDLMEYTDKFPEKKEYMQSSPGSKGCSLSAA